MSKPNGGLFPISYKLVRSQRRTVSIGVEPDGSVVVRAPKRLSTAEIDGFVAREREWIARKQALQRQRADAHPALSIRSGEGFPFLGRTLTLVVSSEARAVSLEGGVLVFPRRLMDRGEAALKQWYRRQALELLSARTAQIAEAAGISYAAVTVTDARHRWGSCGADGRIHFAWRLIMAEPAAIDYVIVHELCHRLELNHSDAFWCHVAALLPDWRPRETWLKDHGALLRLL